jgi:hypothetical protein
MKGAATPEGASISMESVMRRLPFALLLAAACSATAVDTDDDDHGLQPLTLEGQELTDFLAAGAPVQVEPGFRRVGFMWDAVEDGVLEVRTSADGTTWSEWAAPALVTVEEIAHGGHLDAIAVGPDGSTDDDPVVTWYQVRVAAGRTAPTFLVIEPLADIPADADPDESVPDTMDTDDGDPGPTFSVVRSTPIGGIRIYSRADWNARAPRCAGGRMTPNRATIHHTVTPTNDSMSPQARLRQIQSFHMFSRGWCDIGYNYLVSRDGRVWRGRGAVTIGAHVANSNTGNVGISFMGTHTSTAPTQTQMCQVAKLLRRLRMDFPGIQLNRSDVKGHRQYGGTSCPGTALYNRIDLILSKSRNGC